MATASLLALGGLPQPGALGLSLATWRAQAAPQLYALAVLFFKAFPFLLPLLRHVNAPHGRFALPTSRLNLPGNAAWIAMELWSPVVFAGALLSPPLIGATHAPLWQPSLARLAQLPLPNRILALLYLTHYTHRALLQPLRSPPRSPIHLSVALSATMFNTLNGLIMGSWIGGRSPPVELPGVRAVVLAPGLLPSWALESPLFWLGVVGWVVGFAGNVWHDEILMSLRRKPKGQKADKKEKPRYEIPHGGLYRYISYPNYFCEWIEWFSFALAALALSPLSPLSPLTPILPTMTRVALLLSAPPLLFPISEVCAMLPRAVNGHKWYHAKFGVEGDGKQGRYPKDRTAVIPGLI